MNGKIEPAEKTASATVVADLRKASFPLGWTCSAAGAAASVQASNADSPGAGDWFDHAGTPTIASGATGSDSEDAPLAWLRFVPAAGGSVTVRVANFGRVDLT